MTASEKPTSTTATTIEGMNRKQFNYRTTHTYFATNCKVERLSCGTTCNIKSNRSHVEAQKCQANHGYAEQPIEPDRNDNRTYTDRTQTCTRTNQPNHIVKHSTENTLDREHNSIYTADEDKTNHRTHQDGIQKQPDIEHLSRKVTRQPQRVEIHPYDTLQDRTPLQSENKNKKHSFHSTSLRSTPFLPLPAPHNYCYICVGSNPKTTGQETPNTRTRTTEQQNTGTDQSATRTIIQEQLLTIHASKCV